MKITTEIIAQYVEGTLTDEQQQEVQKYLASHPQAMEAVLCMMDEDYDLIPQANVLDTAVGCPVVMNNLSKTSAAFAMPVNPRQANSSRSCRKHNFCVNMDELIESLR